MVQPEARRSDDDLGPMTDKTGRVESCAATASFCGLSAQFFEQLVGSVQVDSSYSSVEYGATDNSNLSSDAGLGWNSVKNVTSVGGFAWGATTLTYLYWSLGHASRVDAKESYGCGSLLERFAILGHKTKNKLIDLRIRLDTMTVDEVRVVRQFGWVQCISAHPIRPQEHRRLANNMVYMVRNMFTEVFWLEAPSYLLTSIWTSISAIPPSRCTNDYMPWFLPRTHPRIQMSSAIARREEPWCNERSLITPHVLLDMISRDLDRDNIDDATKVGRASDMTKKYHHTLR
ncbi:hypothetical protein M9H77_17734 [Catharanthus roseus]|uniref:Uncharacterized protein n=1 Tax=Catharanthus roseus TaxID=4058 RepID=A0ACC0B5H0_CATRO|nr:hypothetical protein M9H77_17734 [Catharanthus roseus]